MFPANNNNSQVPIDKYFSSSSSKRPRTEEDDKMNHAHLPTNTTQNYTGNLEGNTQNSLTSPNVDNGWHEGFCSPEQLIQKFINKLQPQLDTLATKNDLEYINSSVDQLKIENEALKERVSQLEKSLCDIVTSQTNLDCRQRQYNLIFRGISGLEGESYEEMMNKMYKEDLGITQKISMSHLSVGGPVNQPITSRPFFVTFVYSQDINLILKNSSKLKGKSISIQRDYPIQIRQNRSKLLTIRKVIIKELPNKKITVNRNNLIVDNYKFSWVKDNLIFDLDKSDGFIKLNNLLNIDVKALLSSPAS